MERRRRTAAAKPPRSQHSFRMMAAREPATSQVHRPCVHSDWAPNMDLRSWPVDNHFPRLFKHPPNYKNTLRRILPKSSLPFKIYSEFGGEQEQEQEQKREHQQEQRQEQSKSKIGSKSKSRSKGGSNSKIRSRRKRRSRSRSNSQRRSKSQSRSKSTDPSKVAAETKIHPNDKTTFRVSIGGEPRPV